MTRVLPVNLQLGAGILLDTLFPLFTLSVSVREKPLVRLIVTKTPSMDLLPRDVLLLTHSLTHSVHLIALDSLRDCRAPPKRGKEKVGQESDDTEEKPGSASAVCTSRILLLFSVLSFTVYNNFLETRTSLATKHSASSEAMQDETTRTSDLFDYFPSTDWFSPAGRDRAPVGAYLPAWQLSQFLKQSVR